MDNTITETSMIPIPVADFMSGTQLPVDVYVRLSDEKYVCLAKRGSHHNLKELSVFRGNQIQYLHVEKDQFNRYVNTNLIIAGIAVKRPKLANKHKALFLSKATSSAMMAIDGLDLTQETYETAKTVAECTMTLIENRFDFKALLDSLTAQDGHYLNHSLAVSMVSVMVGKKMGWTKQITLEKLALGGLLHDVGMKAIPKEIRNKPRSSMTSEEIQLWETHPFKGMEMLRTIPGVPDDVVACVYEHHENAFGQGFPRKVRDLRLNPLGRVVSIANCFVELCVQSANNSSPMSADRAVQYIENVMGQPFNKQVFRALNFLVDDQQSLAS